MCVAPVHVCVLVFARVCVCCKCAGVRIKNALAFARVDHAMAAGAAIAAAAAALLEYRAAAVLLLLLVVVLLSLL